LAGEKRRGSLAEENRRGRLYRWAEKRGEPFISLAKEIENVKNKVIAASAGKKKEKPLWGVMRKKGAAPVARGNYEEAMSLRKGAVRPGEKKKKRESPSREESLMIASIPAKKCPKVRGRVGLGRALVFKKNQKTKGED